MNWIAWQIQTHETKMRTVKAQEKETKNVLKPLLIRFGGTTRSTLASIIAHIEKFHGGVNELVRAQKHD